MVEHKTLRVTAYSPQLAIDESSMEIVAGSTAERFTKWTEHMVYIQRYQLGVCLSLHFSKWVETSSTKDYMAILTILKNELFSNEYPLYIEGTISRPDGTSSRVFTFGEPMAPMVFPLSITADTTMSLLSLMSKLDSVVGPFEELMGTTNFNFLVSKLYGST